ncbi:beta strand repeat-containing protein [Candidatus Nanohalococcus occultus]|uniref:beta strand repeat-containing protein n=1 Tax=Candidatus Nanohalococcus occultus TaxID=2978047 RepID=UPI0039E04C8C
MLETRKNAPEKLLTVLVLVLLLATIVSATDLQNIEKITPFSSQDINVTGTINMKGNPITNIGNLDGSNIVNSGNINSGAVSVNELDTGSVDDRYVNRGGDVMSGDLNFQSNGGINSANFLNVGSITSNNGDSDILFHQGFTVDGDSGGDGSVTLETGNLNMNNNDVTDFNQLVTGRGGRVMTFNNPNGGNSEIRFRSGENSGSDYGYINAIDDVDGSGENFGLELGTMNDGADASNDHIRLIPAGDLYLNPGGNDDGQNGETIHNGTLNMDGNPITNADWSDAGDLDASGSINDFSAANDLDSSGSLTSGSVSDNEIADNTVDNSEIQNGGSFTFNGVTLNGALNTNGNTLNLDSGDQYITIHDGSGNFNIKSGIDPNNNIVAGTGGTHVRLDESGGFDVSVDESTGTGNAKSEGVGFAVNGGQVEIRDGSLELNNNNINGIGGLQNCGSNEFVNGNGNCEVDTDTDTTVADDQTLSEVLSQGNSAGSNNIDLNQNSLTNVDQFNGVEVDTVRVEAAGNSADDRTHGVWINGNNVFTQGRSYGLLVIDRDTHQVTFQDIYDVYGSASEAERLGNKLQSLGSDKLVIITTFDEPRQDRLTNNLPSNITRVGGSGAFSSSNFKKRSAYILVGIPGLDKGQAFEKYRGEVSDDPDAHVQVTFELRNGWPSVLPEGNPYVRGLGAGRDFDMNGNAITNADWSNAGDLDSSGSINDFSAANDLDSSGNLVSGSVSDNEIADNSVDNSEIQNGADFTFDGVTANSDVTINGDTDVQSDSAPLTVVESGGDTLRLGGNEIDSTTDGLHLQNNNGGNVNVRSNLDMYGNNINNIGGLQNCGANEFVNGNGNCEVDTDTDTTVADDQDLSVGADPAGGGETTIDIDNGNSATFTDDNTQLDDVAATGNVDAGGNRVENVADPNSDDDAVPRGYADSRYAASSDYFWTSISLETGDYRMSNGSSGSMTVPGSGTTNCDGGACIRNFGSGMWGIEMSPPSIAFDEADMPGRVCWGYSGGDNEQDNQGWGAGIRSTITDDNGHCMQGSSIGGSCAASYLYDDSTTSHDTYGVVCKTLD